MKQKFFDRNLIKIEWNFFSIIATIVGVFIALVDFEAKIKIGILIGVIIGLIVVYIGLFIYYKYFCNKVSLTIGKVNLNIKVGDLFEEEGMKVIPVNEYFDTLVDDKLISKTSIHGLFVNKFLKNDTIEDLDNRISSELSNYTNTKNEKRSVGKKEKYKIGTTIIIDEYVLTAFTKFNSKNEAYLSMTEYLVFLNDFWNEISRVHNGRIINVPIIGTGISRINPVLSEQEYLEQIIWSLKTSTLITSKSKVNIIVYSGDKQKISLVKLKEMFKKLDL